MNKNVYTVGKINEYIKNMFAQDFLLHNISIRGEVSNCKYHSSGHLYFTLKDGGGAIRAVMFAGRRKGLTFPMKDGDQVVATGSVEVYERSGEYQLYAALIEPAGQGDLYQRFLERKAQLEEMGMFAQEYKRPIPRYARRIGVVTAPTGAAVQDIRNIAFRRNPHIQLILYPALVQGEGAAQSVARGIFELERLGVDVMIVGRGGGSIEDLWAFNEDVVARAIFDCPVPIISAVGHETDTTIADYVADRRAATPSEAAEIAVFDYAQTMRELARCRESLQDGMRQRLAEARRETQYRSARLLSLSPQNQLNEKRYRAAEAQRRLTECFRKRYEERRSRLCLLSEALEGRSPMKQISRGYAYVQGPDGQALRTVGQVQPGDTLMIRVTDGTVRADVQECLASSE